jgi:hypothetical protein
VNLINWQGSAIFGLGSEWFWSMAQFVVVVVTLGGIYRQLRAQGAANALHRIESLQGRYTSERMEYTKLALALDLKYEAMSNRTRALASPLLNFFVDLGNLHEEGYISLNEITDSWGRPIQIWGALLAPVVQRQRVIEGIPDMWDFHKLMAGVRELEAKRGIPLLQLDQSTLPELLDFVIEHHTANQRLEQEWKSGVIPTAPATVAQASTLDPDGPAVTA